MIGTCAAMGFGLSDIRAWSMWEYRAAVAGWNAAHAPAEDEAPPPPDIEFHRRQKERAAREKWFN